MATKKKAAKKKATKKAKAAPRVKKEKVLNDCGCGCGAKVPRQFAQGHDSKAKSQVKAWKNGDVALAKLPAVLRSQAPALAKRWGY